MLDSVVQDILYIKRSVAQKKGFKIDVGTLPHCSSPAVNFAHGDIYHNIKPILSHVTLHGDFQNTTVILY